MIQNDPPDSLVLTKKEMVAFIHTHGRPQTRTAAMKYVDEIPEDCRIHFSGLVGLTSNQVAQCIRGAFHRLVDDNATHGDCSHNVKGAKFKIES